MEKPFEALTTEQIHGMHKRISLELEKLPLETHQVLVSMLAQMFQHRGLAEQNRLEREKLAREEAREKREAEQALEIEKHIARSRPHLASVPAIAEPDTEVAGQIEVPTGVGVR